MEDFMVGSRRQNWRNYIKKITIIKNRTMKIQIDFDTDNLLANTSSREDQEIGNQFLQYATDDALVGEIESRKLFDEVLDIIPEELIIKKYNSIHEE